MTFLLGKSKNLVLMRNVSEFNWSDMIVSLGKKFSSHTKYLSLSARSNIFKSKH